MVLVEISAKNHKFGYLNPILGKLGVMHEHDLGWLIVEKPVVDFLFAFIELFALSIMVPELLGKMCTARLFLQAVDLFALKFYLDRVVNHQPFSAPDGEYCIALHSQHLWFTCD